MAKPIIVMRIPTSYLRGHNSTDLNDMLRRTALELRDYHFLYIYDAICEQIVIETHNIDNVPESDINDLRERLIDIAEHGEQMIKANKEEMDYSRYRKSIGSSDTISTGTPYNPFNTRPTTGTPYTSGQTGTSTSPFYKKFIKDIFK
jgi:hypothetical protein